MFEARGGVKASGKREWKAEVRTKAERLPVAAFSVDTSGPGWLPKEVSL
jgi:hypothetical protein